MLQILTHIYRIFQSRKCKKPSRKIMLGLLFAIIGLLLYSFIETENNYQVRTFITHAHIKHISFVLLPQRIIHHIILLRPCRDARWIQPRSEARLIRRLLR